MLLNQKLEEGRGHSSFFPTDSNGIPLIAESDLAFVDKNAILENLSLPKVVSNQLRELSKRNLETSIIFQPTNNNNNNNNNSNNNNNLPPELNPLGLPIGDFPLSSSLLSQGMDGMVKVLSKGGASPGYKRQIENMILADIAKMLEGNDSTNNSKQSNSKPMKNANSRVVQALLGEDR